jgi:hypothetical protein
MNWLERARREIQENALRRTAKSTERNLTAVTAGPPHAPFEKFNESIGSNGSTSPSHLLEIELVRDEFEERAALMAFDDGLSCDEA